MKIQTEDKIISLVDWISLHEYFQITEHFPKPKSTGWMNSQSYKLASFISYNLYPHKKLAGSTSRHLWTEKQSAFTLGRHLQFHQLTNLRSLIVVFDEWF